jgi:hypothetical protein
MSPSFTKFFKKILTGLFLLSIFIPVNSQNLIDINTKDTKNLHAQISEDVAVKNMFIEMDRYRPFDYNKQLAKLTSENVGDTLLLAFFNDKQYKSVIQKVATNINGRTSITSKIAGTQFAYCYMTVSEKTITISADLPVEDERFFASVKNEKAYISQVKKSVLDKTALEGTHAMVNFPYHDDYEKRMIKKNEKGIDDPVVIDLLIVYTPAAEQWALENSSVTDIFDLIDIALQLSNTAVQNSKTGITFSIVHIHLTDYVEDDTVEDLYRITDPWDGYMDEVHDLRNQYYADEILFIPKVSFTGGVAWLLNNENGFNPDYYAVALTRVQQTSWTFTAVHEIGHNMGTHHHWAQNFQPGPGLFNYSSGWRGIINGERFCTVMTYESGSYFDDGQNHTRIPYFSSPEIDVDGVTIGDYHLEDNTLTLKRTKTAVANYRTPPLPELNVSPLLLDFENIKLGTTSTAKTIFVSGTNLTEEISYTKEGSDTASFEITQNSWNSNTGGVLRVIFSPTEEKNYEATITFKNSDVADKVVVLKGAGVRPSFNIVASAGAGGTIQPPGKNVVLQGDSLKFTFNSNSCCLIASVLVDGVIDEDAIVNGYYVFREVVKNHTIKATFKPLSVNDNISNNVIVFSYSNSVFIQNETGEPLKSVEIFNMLGRLIYQNEISKSNVVIPLHVSDGIYYIKIISQNQQITTKKVLLLK